MSPTPPSFATVDEVVNTLRAGRMIILVDDEDRENEGDLVIAAEHIQSEHVVAMCRHASGIITTPMTSDRLRDLNIDLMLQDNAESMSTAFTVTVDARDGISTGSSAFDRALTMRKLADPTSAPRDFVRPGHVNPLRGRRGGVLKRPGHTEASLDLMRLAGLRPAAVLCEIMDDQGHMMRMDALREMAERFDMPLATIADLVRYRRRHEKLIEPLGQQTLTTRFGAWTAQRFRSLVDDGTYTAFVHGDIDPDSDTLVRVHASSTTQDLISALRLDADDPVHRAMDTIAQAGSGVLVYIEPSHAPSLQGDERDYGIGAQILRHLGVRRLRLLSSRPTRRAGLDGFDLEIVEHVPFLPARA